MKAQENIWPCILQGLTDDELLRALRMQMKRSADPEMEESADRYIKLIIDEMHRRNQGRRVSRICRERREAERLQPSDSMPETSPA